VVKAVNIAVLSGKGGTGKTTVAVNLAAILKANYVDCDVEEPNGFIFLKPQNIRSQDVKVLNPVIDKAKCTLCGECVKACQFNALFNTKKEILVFEKLCHSCEACRIPCASGALSFQERKIGVIEEGQGDGLTCYRGILDIGEPMAVPVIRQLLKSVPEGLNLLDCSPGTSCNAVSTLKYAQGAILVTEQSAFGLHDLKMAVKLVREFNLPFGLVINKWNESGRLLEEYLRQENIKVLGRLPQARKAAEEYSQGRLLMDIPLYQARFTALAQEVKEVFSCS
jgi:MinD superfamily P-loop ATPase